MKSKKKKNVSSILDLDYNTVIRWLPLATSAFQIRSFQYDIFYSTQSINTFFIFFTKYENMFSNGLITECEQWPSFQAWFNNLLWLMLNVSFKHNLEECSFTCARSIDNYQNYVLQIIIINLNISWYWKTCQILVWNFARVTW